MIAETNFESWLLERSANVRRNESEVIFEHTTGSRSVLLLPNHGNSDLVAPYPALAKFYASFGGGVIGGQYLMIGTPAGEEIQTSVGGIVPTLKGIREISEQQGIRFQADEIPFMTIGYMFVYSVAASGHLRCHDRDYRIVSEDESIADVLDAWWNMELDDPL